MKDLAAFGTQLHNTLYETGLAPDNELWAIRDTCYQCPEFDDHCGIDCNKKGQRYLEKTIIDVVKVVIREHAECHLEITDVDGNQYTERDLGLWIFTKREEAVEQL